MWVENTDRDGPKNDTSQRSQEGLRLENCQRTSSLGDEMNSQRNSFSLTKNEQSPITITYPPATAKASEVLLMSSATMDSGSQAAYVLMHEAKSEPEILRDMKQRKRVERTVFNYNKIELNR